jgi:hypothetical protein
MFNLAVNRHNELNRIPIGSAIGNVSDGYGSISCFVKSCGITYFLTNIVYQPPRKYLESLIRKKLIESDVNDEELILGIRKGISAFKIVSDRWLGYELVEFTNRERILSPCECIGMNYNVNFRIGPDIRIRKVLNELQGKTIQRYSAHGVQEGKFLSTTNIVRFKDSPSTMEFIVSSLERNTSLVIPVV